VIDRRAFIGAIAGGLLAAPLVPEAQRARQIPRIGFLAMGQHPSFAVFTRSLEDLGYVDRRNVSLEPRFAEIGRPDQFDGLAAVLVRGGVDVIVALINPEIAAARRATSTIPIVMVLGADPVGQGFARSLAHPGGNVTGLAWDADPDFNGKSVEMLTELLPAVRRIGGLVDPAFPPTNSTWEAADRAAARKKVQLQRVEVRAPAEFEEAFATMKRARAAGVLVFGGSMLFAGRARIADIALKERLPVMFPYREAVEIGGLISYGPSLVDLWRRAAIYVDRILKGAKPSELPIEQPTKFELVVNLKTAKTLGLTIPPSLLQRADQVIE
jgi:putative ABC transport system substrate-binding protein